MKLRAKTFLSRARSVRSICESNLTVRLRLMKPKRCLPNKFPRFSKAASILFILETFSDLSEIQQAISAIKELCDLPIVAQMTIQTDGKTIFGATQKSSRSGLEQWGADVIGLNCGVGPTHILTALEKMRAVTDEKTRRTAERRTSARRSGAAVLYVFAGIYVEICQTLYQSRREIRRRLLRHDSAAHQIDGRFRSRHQPA